MVYDQMMRFHLVAAQAISHPLRENLRLVSVMLLAAPRATLHVSATSGHDGALFLLSRNNLRWLTETNILQSGVNFILAN